MHDVFISYASPDKNVADAACHALEAAGIRVWIAPRDVDAGVPYAACIVRAIHDCRVMVLIYSEHSNKSGMVLRELERAASLAKPLLPVRVQNVAPTVEMEFFVGREHWLDAITPPLEQHFDKLVRAIQKLLGGPTRVGKASDEELPTVEIPRAPEASARAVRAAAALNVAPTAAEAPSGRHRGPLLIGAGALVALLAVGAVMAPKWLGGSGRPPAPNPVTPPDPKASDPGREPKPAGDASAGMQAATKQKIGAAEVRAGVAALDRAMVDPAAVQAMDREWQAAEVYFGKSAYAEAGAAYEGVIRAGGAILSAAGERQWTAARADALGAVSLARAGLGEDPRSARLPEIEKRLAEAEKLSGAGDYDKAASLARGVERDASELLAEAKRANADAVLAAKGEAAPLRERAKKVDAADGVGDLVRGLDAVWEQAELDAALEFPKSRVAIGEYNLARDKALAIIALHDKRVGGLAERMSKLLDAKSTEGVEAGLARLAQLEPSHPRLGSLRERLRALSAPAGVALAHRKPNGWREEYVMRSERKDSGSVISFRCSLEVSSPQPGGECSMVAGLTSVRVELHAGDPAMGIVIDTERPQDERQGTMIDPMMVASARQMATQLQGVVAHGDLSRDGLVENADDEEQPGDHPLTTLLDGLVEWRRLLPNREVAVQESWNVSYADQSLGPGGRVEGRVTLAGLATEANGHQVALMTFSQSGQGTLRADSGATVSITAQGEGEMRYDVTDGRLLLWKRSQRSRMTQTFPEGLGIPPSTAEDAVVITLTPK